MVRPSPQPSHRPDAAGSGLSLTAPRVSVLVVTGDDGLWMPLTTASHGRDAQQFDSVDELVAQWNPGRAAVVLLDGRGHVSLESAVQALLTHSTALVPVAVVDEAARVAAATLERKRSLFDHILLPLDVGTARTVLDRAAEEAAARLSLVAGDPATRPVARAAGASRPRGLWIGLAAALLAVAAGAGWWLTQSNEPAPAAPPLAATPAPATATAPSGAVPATGAGAAASAPAEEVEAKLEHARSAMRDKRYIDPPADNALAHYKAVLDLDPQNGEARQGLDRIAELLLVRASSAMGGKDYASALRALEAARSIKPDHPRLAALDQQVNQRLKELSAAQVQAALQANAFARVAALLTQAEKTGAMPAEQIAQLRAEAARREASAQLSELERAAQVRISQGRLLEPAGDSARFYLKLLQDRGGPAVADSLAHLHDAYARRLAGDARAAIGRAAWPEVDALLAELRTTNGGASLAQAQALQKEADRAREQLKSRAAEAADAKANAEAARAASTPAAAAVAAPAAPVAATAPKLVKALRLEYPVRAASAGIEGWVEVQFDVTAAGVAEHVRVTAAQPAGVFDREALAAIGRARFVPAKTADGTPLAQATSLKLRFSLSDHK
jgi:periplasmic protein TonB